MMMLLTMMIVNGDVVNNVDDVDDDVYDIDEDC